MELHSTETVPNWALRDAANEWCAANGVRALDNPECTTRKLAGGSNAVYNPAPGLVGAGGGGGFLGSAAVYTVARVNGFANGFARAAMGRLGMSPSMAAHLFALVVLALACFAFSAAIMTLEVPPHRYCPPRHRHRPRFRRSSLE